jgi:autophagy-related protein 17
MIAMAQSPPARDSPTSSQGSFHEPNLEQLVEHLLASKRSLSCINLIWRAREIVDNGREALEDNASLCAKNSFVKCALDKQVDSLEAVRYGATLVDTEANDEFTVRVACPSRCSEAVLQ